MISPDDLDTNIAEGTHNPAAIIGNLRMSGNKPTIPAPSPSSVPSDDEETLRPRKQSKVGRPKKVQWDDRKVKIQDEEGKEVLPPNTKLNATTDGEQKKESVPLLTEMEKKAMEWRKQHPVEDEPKIVEVAKSQKARVHRKIDYPGDDIRQVYLDHCTKHSWACEWDTDGNIKVPPHHRAGIAKWIADGKKEEWKPYLDAGFGETDAKTSDRIQQLKLYGCGVCYAHERKKMIQKGLCVVGAAAVAYVGGKATWWVLSNTVGRLFGSGSVAPAAPVPSAASIMALAEKLEKLSAVAPVPQ